MNTVRIVVVLLLLVSWAQAAPATTAAAPAAERARLIDKSDEIVAVLDNGLTVIAKRVPSPAAAVRAYVRAGGIHEGRWLGGGLSHLLEHLVAGGSGEKRTEAENRRLLQEIGNNSNAYTSTDHTAYFINTTAEHVEKAVDLVAGWIFGAKITPEEYRREYEVVQRELEKGKGEAGRQFWYLQQANRYRVSPAGVPVIGYQEVIQKLTRDDVYAYYQMAYQPGNVVFSLAADLPPQRLLDMVKQYAGDVPAGRAFSHDIADEPPVLSPRSTTGRFPKLGQARLDLSFPTIRLQHPDLYALDLLAAMLGDGESSLLVRELRDRRRLVSRISVSSHTPAYVEGSFSISMQLDPRKIDAATTAALELICAAQEGEIDEARLTRAKTQMKADRVKGMQTAEQVAAALANDFVLTGDPHFTERYLDRIDQVTAADVQRVAQQYLDSQRLITTTLLPAEYSAAPVAASTRPAAATTASVSAVTRELLDNGTVFLHRRITTTPLVAVQAYALGGLTAEDEKTNGLGNLAMQLLPRGTKTHSAEQIAEFWDSIGGDFNTACGNNTWYWSAQFLKPDAERAIEVFADVLNNPSFPSDELPMLKQRVLAAIDSQDADWNAQAMRFFKQAYFGPMNSPYHMLTIGTKENVSGFTAEQLRQWYEQKVLTAPRVLAIYGDIELEQARTLARHHLGGGAKLPPIPQRDLTVEVPVENGDGARVRVRAVKVQKTQQPLAGVVIGFDSGSVIGDTAIEPLAVADTMTSGYGYPTGYLHEILRGRGLVYVVHAVNSPGRDARTPGTFLAYAGCEPAKVSEVVELMLKNLARVQQPPRDADTEWFERSRQMILIEDAMDRQTVGEQAAAAALDELYGLGQTYRDEYAQRIRAVTPEAMVQAVRARLRSCVVTISTPAPELVKVSEGERVYTSFEPVDLTPKGVEHDSPK